MVSFSQNRNGTYRFLQQISGDPAWTLIVTYPKKKTLELYNVKMGTDL